MKIFPIPIKKFSLIFILFVFLIFLLQINSSDGFKLRDFKEISEKRSNTVKRRDNGIPLRKIEKVFHDSYDDDDDDDDIMIDIESAEDVQDDDDDDDDDEEINVLQDDDDDGDDSEEISVSTRKPYVFQKVRQSTMSRSSDDDEDDGDDDNDENDDESDKEVDNGEDNDSSEEVSTYVFQKVRRRQYNLEPDAYKNKLKEKRKFDEDDDDEDEIKENIITSTIASWVNYVKDIFNIIPETISEKKEMFTAWLKEKRATEEIVESESSEHIDKGTLKPKKQETPLLKTELVEEVENENIRSVADENEDSKRGFLSWMSTLKEKFAKTKEMTMEADDEETETENVKSKNYEPTKTKPMDVEPKESEQQSTVSQIKTEAKEFMSLIKETSSSLLNSLITPEDGSEDSNPSIVDKILDTEKSKASEQKQKREKKKETKALEQFDQLLLNLPSFVPNYTNVHNQNCINQGQLFQRQLRNQKHWALQMMDASAKIPAGLLRGNVNQLGDFDLCTDILSKIQINNDKKMKMRGKYCLAHVDVTAVHNDLRLPVYLMQGRSFLRSSLKDPSHFLPRFTTFNWGICLPSGCDHNDVTRIIEDGIRQYNTTGIRLYVKVAEENCHVKRRIDYFSLVKNNWQIAATISYYLAVIMLVVLASLNDYWLDWKANLNKNKKNADQNAIEESNSETEGTMNQILMSFSLKRTVKELLENPSDKSTEIECIHGIKTIATIMMYFALKLIPLARVPFTNRIYFTEFFNSPFSVFIRAAIMYADIFLLISGILSAYTVSIRVGHQGSVNWFKRLVGRILRLTPALLAVLLYYAWVWEYTGSGPLWGDLVKNNAEICKTNLWQNLFYIQNWFPFSQTCATHTNQLGIDMQFYLISPLIIYLLHKTPAVGLGMFGILHGISAAMRYSATLNNRLSPVIFHGMKLSQFYRTADLSFNAPLHRATPYFTGVGLGFILSQIQSDVKLPKGVIITGWVSSIWAILWCFWTSSHLALKNYQYDPVEAAAFNAWSPLIWSLSICWIVFACFSGNGNKLNKLMGSRLMRIFSKISYSLFLVQFLVFFYKAASIRHSTQFNFADSMFDWNEISITIGLAIILTLSFDLPFQSIKRILLLPSINSSEDSKEGAPEDGSATLTKRLTDNGIAAAHEPDFISPFVDDDEEEDYLVKIQPKKLNNTISDSRSSNYLTDTGKSEVIQNVWDDDEEGFWNEEENEPISESNHIDSPKMNGLELRGSSEPEDDNDDDEDEDEDEESDEEEAGSEIEIKSRPVTYMTSYKWSAQED